MKKKILFYLLAFVAGFSFIINNVKADGTPDLAANLVFYEEGLNSTVAKDPKLSLTYYKYAIDQAKGYAGVAYCIDKGYDVPPDNSTITRVADISDPRLVYILEHGYSMTKGNMSKGDLYDLTEDQAYYVTQMAVWLYKGRDANNPDPKKGPGYLSGDMTQSNLLVQRAIKLYNDSAAATELPSNPWMDNSVGSWDLHYDAGRKGYISDPMHVVGYVFTEYTTTLSNAPAGSKLIRANGEEIANGSTRKFLGNDGSAANDVYYIFVPESSVKSNVTGITLTITANTFYNRAYQYQLTNAQRQPLVILVPVNDTVSKVQTYNIKIPDKKSKKCAELVPELLKKYPNNRTESNKEYMNALNEAIKQDSSINTELGVENPRCDVPKCNEIISYLKKKYPKSTTPAKTINGSTKNYGYIPYYEDEAGYIDELKGFMKKHSDINVDAGYDNPKCEAPKCEEVLKYLNRAYPKCDPKNQEYLNELKKLQGKYKIYYKDPCKLSCEPITDGPTCESKKEELYKKYPNPADRNANNSSYINDVDAIIKIGQENGWTFYKNDLYNADCVQHSKREIRIRKLGCNADGKTNCGDLPGATLAIKDAGGNIIYQWVTDGSTKVFTDKDLKPGTYTVVELVIPAGYNAGKEVKFTIPDDDKDYIIDVDPIVNTRPPETGDINFTLIMTAFILFLGFGIFGLIKTSQREEM